MTQPQPNTAGLITVGSAPTKRLTRKLIQFSLGLGLILVLLSGALSARTYSLIENVWATRLAAGCELWNIQPPVQPVRTLVLACPGTDLIRLWPWPVQTPWFEDPEQAPGLLGNRIEEPPLYHKIGFAVPNS